MFLLVNTYTHTKQGTHLEVIDMLITLFVVMVSWVYTYVQTQNVYTKYVQLFVYLCIPQ